MSDELANIMTRRFPSCATLKSGWRLGKIILTVSLCVTLWHQFRSACCLSPVFHKQLRTESLPQARALDIRAHAMRYVNRLLDRTPLHSVYTSTCATRRLHELLVGYLDWSSCAREIHGRTVVVFRSRFFEPSGFALSSISLLTALAKFEADRFFVALENDGPNISEFVSSLSSVQMKYLEVAKSRLSCARSVPYVYIHSGVPFDFVCPSGAYCIGRTAFETTSLPDSYKASLSRMHEIWTYSAFNEKTFRDGGVTTVRESPAPFSWHQFHCVGIHSYFLQKLDALVALSTETSWYLIVEETERRFPVLPSAPVFDVIHHRISIQTTGMCGFTIRNRHTGMFLTCVNGSYTSGAGFSQYAIFGVELLDPLNVNKGLKLRSQCEDPGPLYPLYEDWEGGVQDFRVRSVPDAYDLSAFKQSNSRKIPQLDKCGFTFLSVFAWNERKDPRTLLLAFLNAFENESDTCLLLRTYPKGEVDCDALQPCHERWIWDEIGKILHEHGYEEHQSQVIVVAEHLDDSDMRNLYTHADAYVSTTHGEGLGKPIVEAMIAGLPIIVTNWSAPADYLNDSTAYLLSSSLVGITQDVAGTDANYSGNNQWAQVNEESVKQVLKTVRQDPNARIVGQRAKATSAEMFLDKNVAEQMAEHLSKTSVSVESNISCQGMADVVVSFAGGSKTLKDVRFDRDSDPNGFARQRHRDNHELNYALRSLLYHAPWVRKVFIISDNPPEWLNLTSSKVEVITEGELLGALHATPTANSLAIEAAVHTLDALHECFVYMNDDYFFARDLPLKEFFDEDTQHFNLFVERDKHTLPSWSLTKPINAHDASFQNANVLLDLYYGHREERSFVPHVPHFFVKSMFKRMPPLFKLALSHTTQSTIRSYSDVHTAYLFNYHVMESQIYHHSIIDCTERVTAANQPVVTVFLVGEEHGDRWKEEIGHLEELSRQKSSREGPTFFSIQDAMSDGGNAAMVDAVVDLLEEMFPTPSSLERKTP